MGKALSVLVLIMLLFAGPVSAAGRVRLVVMDGINLEHLDDQNLESFQFLLDQGAVGLANSNTAGGRTPENSAITLGAGSRAVGPGAALILNSNDSFETSQAGEVHARRTGIWPPLGSLVMPSIARVNEANSELLYKVHVGYLADTLAAGGKTVAALVNADGEEVFRPAAAIVADGNGIVMDGYVGNELLIIGQMQPFGVQSNLVAYTKWLDQLRETDLIVIDLGDVSRSQEYSVLAVEGLQLTFRAQALAQLDQLLGLLLEQHQEGDLLLVIGLQADRSLGIDEGKWLVPVLAYGEGFGPGLLTSPSTRRQGLLANFDITATILRHFDLYRMGDIHGQPMESVSHSAPLSYLLVREHEMSRVYLLRTPLIKGFIGVIIILVALSVAALFMKWQRLELLKMVLVAVVASPLILLVLGAIPGSVLMVPVWIVMAIGLALVFRNLNPVTAMRILGGITALAVVLDALFGAWLQQRSVLGYDAIAGARYYGIGNEYMGVLLGSTLLAASGFLVRRKLVCAIIFAAVTLLLMLPGVGANFGGTLAAITGFSVALMGSNLLRNKKQHRLLAVLAISGAAIALILFNIYGVQSHVGRFFVAVFSDPSEFILAVQRKLAMSWRLVRWSLWSRAFAVLFVAALWLLFTNRRILARRLGQHWPEVRGGMAAALAALLLNDSGVVAAATTLLFLTLPLLYYEFCSSSWVNDSHSA